VEVRGLPGGRRRDDGQAGTDSGAHAGIKEEALSKTIPIDAKAGRYQPDDDLLAFLKGL
jgi:hypothetical protein